jgi:general secretion pathway protein H
MLSTGRISGKKVNRRVEVEMTKKGFTLIELLVVLVIISMMAAFVGPRIAGSMSNMNLKTASKKIAASLRYARSQAVSESRTYVALFDLDKNRMVIRGDQTAQEEEEKDDGGGDRDSRQTKRYELPKDVRLDKAILGEVEIDSGLFKIIFFSNGGSSGGELVLSNDRRNRYEVKVDFITGTVRLGAVSRAQREQ